MVSIQCSAITNTYQDGGDSIVKAGGCSQPFRPDHISSVMYAMFERR